MKSGKAPGGDGLPLEFYVQFGDTLYPEILKNFQDSKKMGSLPPSMRETIKINIPKAGKDPGKLDSYRPISFITADVKILAKILANRLQKVIGGLINKDQTGFIPTQATYDNILHLFLNIQAPIKKTTNDAILTLDASKAFDRVEWPYLWQVLRRMGFGPIFMEWVQLLYIEPTARVCIGNALSRPGKGHQPRMSSVPVIIRYCNGAISRKYL